MNSNDPKSLLLQLTVGELEAVVARAVAAGVLAAKEPPLEYLTREQVASILQVTEKTVVTYIETRGLVASKLGQDWRFLRTDVERFMVDHHYKNRKAG